MGWNWRIGKRHEMCVGDVLGKGDGTVGGHGLKALSILERLLGKVMVVARFPMEGRSRLLYPSPSARTQHVEARAITSHRSPPAPLSTASLAKLVALHSPPTPRRRHHMKPFNFPCKTHLRHHRQLHIFLGKIARRKAASLLMLQTQRRFP
jgi:hypothetical protein